jgi:hypothetical protein
VLTTSLNTLYVPGPPQSDECTKTLFCALFVFLKKVGLNKNGVNQE